HRRDHAMTAKAHDRPKLYRLHNRSSSGLDLFRSSELADALFAKVTCNQRPDHPACPEGQWYCENEDCVVREVCILAKYLDGVPPKCPPRMRCPSCGEPMTFHHYIKHLTLIPHTGPG